MSTADVEADATAGRPESDWRALGGVGSFWDLLDRLETVHGVKIGPDKVVRLATVVATLAARKSHLADGTAAARIIAPLVAVTSEGYGVAEQAVVDWWNETKGIKAAKPGAENYTPPPRKREFQLKRLALFGVIGALFLVGAIGAYFAWSGGTGAVVINVSPISVTETESADTLIAGWLLALFVDEILPRLFMATLVIGITAVWWTYSRRPRAEALGREQAAGKFAYQLTPPHTLEQTQSADVRQAGRFLRRPVEVDSNLLDVVRSVAATIRTGGFPTIFRRKVKRTPDCLFIVDTLARGDHLAALADELAQRLARGGVDFVRYDFRRNLDVLEAVDPRFNGRPVIHLGDLAERHPGARIVVVGTGESFFRPGSTVLRQDLDALVEVNGLGPRLFPGFEHSPILITPTPRSKWGPREARLNEARMGVVAFDSLEEQDAGILKLTEFVATDQPVPKVEAWTRSIEDPLLAELDRDRVVVNSNITPPDAYASRLARLVQAFVSERQPDDDDLPAPDEDDLAYSLDPIADDPARRRAAMGLAGLAIFPLLDPAWTPHIWQHVTGRPLDPTRLARLASLPWFRLGRMPDWLRARLVNFLRSPADRIEVAGRLIDFVEKSITREPDTTSIVVHRPLGAIEQLRARLKRALSLSSPEVRRVFEESLFFNFIDRPETDVAHTIVRRADSNRPTITQWVGITIGAIATLVALVFGRWLHDGGVSFAESIGATSEAGNLFALSAVALVSSLLVGLGASGQLRPVLGFLQRAWRAWIAYPLVLVLAGSILALSVIAETGTASGDPNSIFWFSANISGYAMAVLILIACRTAEELRNPSETRPLPEGPHHYLLLPSVLAGPPLAILLVLAAFVSAQWWLVYAAISALALWIMAAFRITRLSRKPMNRFLGYVASALVMAPGSLCMVAALAFFGRAQEVTRDIAVIATLVLPLIFIGAMLFALLGTYSRLALRTGAAVSLSAALTIFLLLSPGAGIAAWIFDNAPLATFGVIATIVIALLWPAGTLLANRGRALSGPTPIESESSSVVPSRLDFFSIFAAPIIRAEPSGSGLDAASNAGNRLFVLIYCGLVGMIFAAIAIGMAAAVYDLTGGGGRAAPIDTSRTIFILIGAAAIAMLLAQFFTTTVAAISGESALVRKPLDWSSLITTPWWATIALWAVSILPAWLGTVHVSTVIIIGYTPALAFLAIPIAIAFERLSATRARNSVASNPDSSAAGKPSSPPDSAGADAILPILVGLIPFVLGFEVAGLRTPAGLWMIPATLLLIRAAGRRGAFDGRPLRIRELDGFGPDLQPVLTWVAAALLLLIVSVEVAIPLPTLGALEIEPAPMIFTLLFVLGLWLPPVMLAEIAIGCTAVVIAARLSPLSLPGVMGPSIGISLGDGITAILMPFLGRAILRQGGTSRWPVSVVYLAFLAGLIVLATAPVTPIFNVSETFAADGVLRLGDSIIIAAALAYGLTGARLMASLLPGVPMPIKLIALAVGVASLGFAVAETAGLTGSILPTAWTYFVDLVLFLGFALIANAALPASYASYRDARRDEADAALKQEIAEDYEEAERDAKARPNRPKSRRSFADKPQPTESPAVETMSEAPAPPKAARPKRPAVKRSTVQRPPNGPAKK